MRAPEVDERDGALHHVAQEVQFVPEGEPFGSVRSNRAHLSERMQIAMTQLQLSIKYNSPVPWDSTRQETGDVSRLHRIPHCRSQQIIHRTSM